MKKGAIPHARTAETTRPTPQRFRVRNDPTSLVAALAHGSDEGVWLVELAALSEGEAVPGAVADVLGIKAEDGRALVEVLADQDLLLVLAKAILVTNVADASPPA